MQCIILHAHLHQYNSTAKTLSVKCRPTTRLTVAIRYLISCDWSDDQVHVLLLLFFSGFDNSLGIAYNIKSDVNRLVISFWGYWKIRNVTFGLNCIGHVCLRCDITICHNDFHWNRERNVHAYITNEANNVCVLLLFFSWYWWWWYWLWNRICVHIVWMMCTCLWSNSIFQNRTASISQVDELHSLCNQMISMHT